MSSDQTTSLSALLKNDELESQPHQEQMQEQMQEQVQRQQQQQQQQQQKPLKQHVQQTEIKEIIDGDCSTEPVLVKKKDFFGFIKDIDYKSTLLVFAILLLLTSSIYTTYTRSYLSGAVGPDGKITVIGSLIASFVGALVFLFIKFVGKF
jgi:cation transport ATPase